MRLSEQFALINRFRKSAPVDVEGLALALGLRVDRVPLPEDISGMIEPYRDGYRIVVNSDHADTRQRFTLAHELGHFMLHRHLIKSGLGDDRAYRSADTGQYRNTLVGRPQETEANRFAAALLMPTEQIERIKAEGVNDPSVLARRLGVSEHAMHIRLGISYQPSDQFSF